MTKPWSWCEKITGALLPHGSALVDRCFGFHVDGVAWRRRGRTGSALPAALITCLVAGTAAGIAVNMSIFRYRLAADTLRGERAAATAEGGAEIAVSSIASAAASGNPVAQTGSGTIGSTPYTYEIIDDRVRATATVEGVTRTVSVYGVSKGYWCKYAYFANYFNIPNANGTPGSSIWLITGDRIQGETHCNHDIYIAGNPVFEGNVSLCGSVVLSSSTVNSPSYSNGAPRVVTPIQLSSIDFALLKQNAQSGGIVVQGSADIRCSGTQMVVRTSTSTNTFTIGETTGNIIYVANGALANPGAGSWQGRIVTNSESVWLPQTTSVTTNPGYWGAGIAQGGGNCPTMYTDTAYTPNVRYAWRWDGYTFDYRTWNGSYWSSSYTDCYDWRSRWVDEIVYTDYKTSSHYE